MDATSHLLRARWIFPVSGPPIEDGVIEIENGRITRLDSGPDPEAVDLGDVAILPGLVNCHTHLEFSGLAQPLQPASPFAEWIHSVIQYRRNAAEDVAASFRSGLEEIRATGTTLVGEIATSPVSQAALDEHDIDATLFLEVLGLDDDALLRQTAAVAGHCRTCDGTRVQPGISPHAPYSVHPQLLRWAIETARDLSVPVAMHLAETREELELLSRGTGPLVELLRSLGVWREGVIPAGTTIGDYLAQLAEAPRVLVIHGNYLTQPQIDFIAAQPHFSVIYCPRTHAYFGHEPHPWRRMLERGINVALGTDSRASNPDLSLWSEVLFLRRQFPEFPADKLLQMATIQGAAALGRSETAGSLLPGRPADLAVVALPGEGSAPLPEDLLLHPASRIVRTMQRGRWL